MEFAVGSNKEEKTMQTMTSTYVHDITLALQSTISNTQRVKFYEAEKKSDTGLVC